MFRMLGTIVLPDISLILRRDKLGSNFYPRTHLLPRYMLSGYSDNLYGVILSRSKQLWKRQREPLTIAC